MLGHTPEVIWHSSEDMHEVPDHSVKLLIGASVHLEDWDQQMDLYNRVYVEEGLRVLRNDGYFVNLQTDQYRRGLVVPKNTLLSHQLTTCVLNNDGEYNATPFFEMLDVKVWQRRKADFYQVPFSIVYVYRPYGGTAKRPGAASNKAYFQGVWNYPQQKNVTGVSNNAYPVELCRLLVKSFTEPGDLICDPFCGTATLLGVAAAMGRRAVGYEINQKELEAVVQHNLNPSTHNFSEGFGLT